MILRAQDGRFWNADRKTCSASGLISHGNRAAVALDNLTADIQAKPQPSIVAHRRGALEPLENALEVCLGYSGTVIGDRDDDALRIVADEDLYRVPARVLQRILENVHHDLPHPDHVPTASGARRPLL